MSSEHLWLVVPCYHESARCGKFLSDLRDATGSTPWKVTIQVVDDGSGPEEARALAEVVEGTRSGMGGFHFAEPLLLPHNLGKGGAVYAGWNTAPPSATWLGFIDADGATPARELQRMVETAAAAHDAVDGLLASRVKMLGRTVHRTAKRHIVGRVYATLSSVLTGFSVYDSQCGCKIFRAACIRKIQPHLTETGFGFDMELLTLLSRAGARLVEFPVDWEDIPGSKVRLFRDSVRMFASLWRLRAKLRKLET